MNKWRGFTIVELLIVIVVIAILAAITVAAYNGVQTRAKNTKTVNAITSWAKAIKLYEVEKGSWPSDSSCLGSSTTYTESNSQCWNSGMWKVNSTFLTQLAPYATSLPDPDTTDITNGGANTPRRGALYHATNIDIYAAFSSISTCPNVGLTLTSTNTADLPGGIYCIYTLD